jgi:hypothetical protein
LAQNLLFYPNSHRSPCTESFYLEAPLSGYQIALTLTLLAALVVLIRRFLEKRIPPSPSLLVRNGEKTEKKPANCRKSPPMERLRQWVFPNLPMV